MKKIILFSSPIILLLEMYILSIIASLISLPSDVAVFLGIVLFCIFALTNYYLFIFIKKTIKQKEKVK